MNPVRALRALVADVRAIRANTEKIMSAQDDLTNAIAGLTTAVSAENTQIDTLVGQLAAEAKSAGMPDAAVEGYVNQLGALTASINGKLAQFAPTPAPAADPSVGATAGTATGAAATSTAG